MKEKILEKPINRSVESIRKEINKKLEELKAKSPAEVDKFKINYQWNGEGNELLVRCEKFQLYGRAVFSDGKLTIYAEIPFYLLPFMWLFRDRYAKMLENEIDKIVGLE